MLRYRQKCRRSQTSKKDLILLHNEQQSVINKLWKWESGHVPLTVNRFFFFQNTSHKNEQTDRHTTIPYIDKFTFMKFHALWFEHISTWHDLDSCRCNLKSNFLHQWFYGKHNSCHKHVEFMSVLLPNLLHWLQNW